MNETIQKPEATETALRAYLKRTRSSSQKFGNCEICNEYADEIYFEPKGGNFGHRECLMKTLDSGSSEC